MSLTGGRPDDCPVHTFNHNPNGLQRADGLPRRQTCVLNHKRLRAPPRHRSALKATADDEQDTGFAGEDFYTILGVVSEINLNYTAS